jgi:heme A synthase
LASGVALVLVALLALIVWRRSSPGEPIRVAAAWSAGAIVAEALIGAAIVFYEWVAADSSLARVIAVPLHLLNTFLLLAALTLVAWFGRGGGSLSRTGPPRRWLIAGALGLLAIAATGAVTALADTLFPKDGSGSLSAAHFLSDLRVAHPLVALGVLVAAALAAPRPLPQPWRLLAMLTIIEFAIGAANIWLGTPIWIQLVHLLVADLIWVTYVWLGARVLSRSEANSVADEVGLRQTIPEHR